MMDEKLEILENEYVVTKPLSEEANTAIETPSEMPCMRIKEIPQDIADKFSRLEGLITYYISLY